ncbi:hypothetical protein [uncultured Roseobacter sp.]|uniref:hypothetical protein n=1 Tax=uncultured Roseobacter sp. TaxID=114847 RepID=UPI002623DC35|nr:hypothetical protein [uncultured Roseobacter sp.]
MRLTLIRQSILEVSVQGQASRYTVFRLLNRVMFALSEPVVFLLLKKEQDRYRVDVFTPSDPLNRANFRSSVVERLEDRVVWNQETGEIDRLEHCEALEPTLIRLFETDFYLVGFRVVEPDLITPFQERGVTFKFISSDDQEDPSSDQLFRLLQDVFLPLPSDITRLRPNQDFEAHFAKLFAGSIDEAATLDSEYEGASDKALRKFLEVYDVEALMAGVERTKCVLDHFDQDLRREIARIAESPLLSGEDRGTPNLTVFRKTFSRSRTDGIRYHFYHYDPVPFILQEQLEGALKCILRGEVPLLNRDQYRFADQNDPVERWFRQELARFEIERSLNGSEILEVLDRPISPHLRLMVDFTLFSGSGLIYRDPFATGQLGWIDPSASEDVKVLEQKRLAILHYFLLARAPKEVQVPHVLILPIRLSGAVCMAVTCIVDGAAVDDESARPFGSALVDVNEFQHRTFLYHGLIREFESKLRRKTTDTYLRAIADIVGHHVLETFDWEGNGDRQKHGNVADIGFRKLSVTTIARINKQLQILTRYCPFDAVEFRDDKPNPGDGVESGAVKYGGSHKLYFIHERTNKFFDRAAMHLFLKDTMTERLQEMVNARIGEWRSFTR